MFDLLVDIYGLTEVTLNSEPADEEPSLLYADVLGAFIRLSGQTRFTAAATGVALTHLLAVESKSGITERCQVRNVRTRESMALPAQPIYYQIKYVNWGRRGHHLELALEAVLVP